MKPTQEQVIAWARECGDWNGQTAEMNDVGLERLNTLAYEAGRKDENEACAKVCEEYAKQIALAVNESLVLHCAAAIRARRF